VILLDIHGLLWLDRDDPALAEPRVQKSASCAVRTTLDINDSLMAEAKAQAAREHVPLTRLIEEGLALRLRPRPESFNPKGVALPVHAGVGGLNPAIGDPSSNRALLDAADGPADP
jgi:hypothetical protein